MKQTVLALALASVSFIGTAYAEDMKMGGSRFRRRTTAGRRALSTTPTGSRRNWKPPIRGAGRDRENLARSGDRRRMLCKISMCRASMRW